jgi:hypothetical protein
MVLMEKLNQEAFLKWAEQKWPNAYANGALIFPAIVHVSDACLAQARAAYPPNADVEFGVCFKIAAGYYDELRRKFHAGQVRHELSPPMHGAWYILLYLNHLYVDDHEHPVPTRLRKAPLEQD